MTRTCRCTRTSATWRRRWSRGRKRTWPGPPRKRTVASSSSSSSTTTSDVGSCSSAVATEKTSDWRVTRRLCLGHPPPVRSPPAEGYSLRATRPDELQDRERIADLLNVAFGRTFHTAEEYGAFTRTAPSFAADLDLVAVAPDGSFASYVGIAYDGANRRGIVEPVCTHPDHRRNGLARALIREGLTRLEARGVSTPPSTRVPGRLRMRSMQGSNSPGHTGRPPGGRSSELVRRGAWLRSR